MANNTPNDNPATLEEARALLLEYRKQYENERTKAETLSSQIAEMGSEIESLRTLNQKFFLMISQGKEEEEEEEKEVPSLEDYAKTLKGVIK